jgi:hypothetical protein
MIYTQLEVTKAFADQDFARAEELQMPTTPRR